METGFSERSWQYFKGAGMDKNLVEIHPGFFLIAAVYLLSMPLRAMNGMLIAALLHEMGHLLASAFLGGKVRRIVIGAWGIQLQADFSCRWQSGLAILAGPAVSLLLVFLYPEHPSVAIWGLMQCLVNLLPLYPLDGGRLYRLLRNP